MKSNPIIGIVVPIYNVENYLRRCLDSLIHQTYPHLQIVLVNDGSTDQSLEIAKEYLKKDSRFILIDKPNGGLSSARNTGIEFFKKQFVLKACDEKECDEKACDEIKPHNEIESRNAKKYSEIKKCDEMESCNEATKPHNETEKYSELNPRNEIEKHNQTEKHNETKLKTKNCFKITGENPRAIQTILSSPPPLEEISYLFFIDSDDSIHLDCLETYLKNAEEHSLEIVTSGVEEQISDHKENKFSFGAFKGVPRNQVLSGEAMFHKLSQKFFYAAWNLLINFDFFKKTQLSFIDGILYEDCGFGTLLFLQAKRVMVLERYFYIYSFSQNSIMRPKEITEERKILDFKSWYMTIKQLESCSLGRDVIECQISHCYLPMLYSCLSKIKNKGEYAPLLKEFKYRSFRIFLARYFGGTFLFFKKLKGYRLLKFGF